jgi:hypothetical protein
VHDLFLGLETEYFFVFESHQRPLYMLGSAKAEGSFFLENASRTILFPRGSENAISNASKELDGASIYILGLKDD